MKHQLRQDESARATKVRKPLGIVTLGGGVKVEDCGLALQLLQNY